MIAANINDFLSKKRNLYDTLLVRLYMTKIKEEFKMKSYIMLLFSLAFIVFLTGCTDKNGKTSKEDGDSNTYFEAVILEIQDTYLLVEPLEDTPERRSADKITLSLNKLEDKDSLTYLETAEVGDTIKIGYQGGIAESYPAQIHNVFEIKLVTKAKTTGEKTSSDQIFAEDTEPEALPKRMVMIKGTLYYDTEKETDLTGRCGVMDGKITSTIDSDTIPTKDNQSNFGKGYEYQFARTGEVEVVIDGTWIVFRNQAEEDANINPNLGVTMTVKEDSLSNTKLTVIVNNNSSHDLMFGSYYRIEKAIDGNWQPLPYKEQEHDIGWNDIGYEVLAGESFEFEPTDWEWLYGALESGEYRFVKDATIGRGENITRYYFAVTFSITE